VVPSTEEVVRRTQEEEAAVTPPAAVAAGIGINFLELPSAAPAHLTGAGAAFFCLTIFMAIAADHERSPLVPSDHAEPDMAIHYMHYNFCHIHQTLRVTPATASGATDRLWDLSDLVAVIE